MFKFTIVPRIDYLHATCTTCHADVVMTYLGWKGGVPEFRASCIGCKKSAELKVTPMAWPGLPEHASE